MFVVYDGIRKLYHNFKSRKYRIGTIIIRRRHCNTHGNHKYLILGKKYDYLIVKGIDMTYEDNYIGYLPRCYL